MRPSAMLAGEFLADESGATMVEYAVMVSLIAAVCIGALGIFGGKVNDLFGVLNSGSGV